MDLEPKIITPLTVDGKQDRKITLVASETYDGSGTKYVYREQRISAYEPQRIRKSIVVYNCIADMVVTQDIETGELKVVITSDGNGDGDHSITIWPERHPSKAITIGN